jgi:anti-sigma regulatory factor (Ser/Thr protein kinase)
MNPPVSLADILTKEEEEIEMRMEDQGKGKEMEEESTAPLPEGYCIECQDQEVV